MRFFMFFRQALVLMLLLSMTACVVRPERRVLENKQPVIQHNGRTGRITYNRKPTISILSITKSGTHFVRLGKQTVLLHFALKVEHSDYWLKPGDTFVFTYQDYTGMPDRSTELRLLIDKRDEVAQHSIGSLTGGQLFIKLFAPVYISAGQTRYFTLVMDTTMFERGEKFFIALKEYRGFVDELIDSTAFCDIRTTVRFR